MKSKSTLCKDEIKSEIFITGTARSRMDEGMYLKAFEVAWRDNLRRRVLELEGDLHITIKVENS